MNMIICIIGLGYVGLTLAVYLAKKGFQVHGVEINPFILSKLKEKEAHFYETGFNSVLREVIESGNFCFTSTIPDFNTQTVYIITVGTPINKNKKVNLESLMKATKNVAEKLKNDDIVILRSTVKVGTTRNFVKPILDRTGKNYYLAFCPERTIEGNAFNELEKLPQIVGGVDQKSTQKVTAFFNLFCQTVIPVSCSEVAELAKLINNAERDLLFAIANELALICHEVGIDVHELIDACTFQYPRSHLKKPGPVAGPCLSKDTWILAESFHSKRRSPTLFLKGRMINEQLIGETLKDLLDYLKSKGVNIRKVAILGFAFKGNPPTSDLRGSSVFDVVNFFRKNYPEIELIGHDYLADLEEIYRLTGIKAYRNVKSAVKDVDLIILHNNHPEYSKENWNNILRKNIILFDFWKQLDLKSKNYLYLGNLKTERMEV